MEATEGQAVVQQSSAISKVENVDRQARVLAERFSDGNIEGCVIRQVGVGIPRVRCSVVEAGAVGKVYGGKGAIGELRVEAGAEGVALIVIERGVGVVGCAVLRCGGDADEPASEGAALLGNLI